MAWSSTDVTCAFSDQLASDKAELGGMLERIALNAKLIESLKQEIADKK